MEKLVILDYTNATVDFYDVEPEFIDEFNLNDYTDYNYYNDSYYTPSEKELFSDDIDCDGESVMDDFLNIFCTILLLMSSSIFYNTTFHKTKIVSMNKFYRLNLTILIVTAAYLCV